MNDAVIAALGVIATALFLWLCRRLWSTYSKIENHEDRIRRLEEARVTDAALTLEIRQAMNVLLADLKENAKRVEGKVDKVLMRVGGGDEHAVRQEEGQG